MLTRRDLLLSSVPLLGIQRPPGESAGEPYLSELHWANDAIRMFAALGLLELPFRTGTGRTAYTRPQFARFTADIAANVNVVAGLGRPELPRRTRSWRGTNPLAKLADEFATEIAAAGIDREWLGASVERGARLWKDGRPQGHVVPVDDLMLSTALPYLPDAWRRGARRAAEEWEQGRASLSTRRRPASLATDMSDALLFAHLGEQKNTPREGTTWQNVEIAGHNAEVFRRLREHGAPKASTQLGWTSILFDLEGHWHREREKVLRLDREHPGALLPRPDIDTPGTDDCAILWRVEQAEPNLEHLPRLRDGRLGRRKKQGIHRLVLNSFPWTRDIELRLPGFPPRDGRLELLWGPLRTGTAFFRLRVENDREKPYRLYAVDLRTGIILNAAASIGDR